MSEAFLLASLRLFFLVEYLTVYYASAYTYATYSNIITSNPATPHFQLQVRLNDRAVAQKAEGIVVVNN